ncbi:VOC family protein [Pseudonocardia kunmingensis]|uniref:Glyoxalase-like protein n=1 Tax=Pseudonocardia kunmingensis TaxID=630975 RepID=A0A543DVR9_9PSEU|nr:VOC family protein [Pseudonocardia kunmingensis]TQM13415.1 glyoxalase-like protein [Pseudonocardia kunmingensis]
MIEPRLDHLVHAGPDLDALVAEFTERTGVAPVLGGRHVGRGTRNHLVGLGGNAYLELIGPDDPAVRPLPEVFGIDRLTASRLAAWVVRPDDLDATVQRARDGGYDPGDIAALSRRTPDGRLLEWRLTPNRGDRFGGLAPALIDWQDARHPTADGLPQLRLVSLVGRHPDPPAVESALAALDVQLDVTTGPPGLEAVLDTPHGRITL